jgi:hypothetical protein
MYYENSKMKSTVVELADGLALLEVPICDEGGSAKNLRDHSEGGEKVLRTLEHHFPHKPLRYLLHSHWHPHSLSSVNPFLKKGVQIFTTKSNFDLIRPFADSVLLARNAGNIHVVTLDSLRLGDGSNSAVIYYFQQKDFPNAPTAEYLYFYLPRYRYFHCGCMYNKWEGDFFEGREIRTGREEDLYKFLEAKHLSPAALIRLNVDKAERNGVQAFSGLQNVVRNGISGREISQPYRALSDEILTQKTDSLALQAIRSGVPPQIFNSLAYYHLGENQLSRALAFARLQAAVNPSDPNAWDSLGEVYWFLGEKEVARHFGRQAQKISPDFKDGGEVAWEKNLRQVRQ